MKHESQTPGAGARVREAGRAAPALRELTNVAPALGLGGTWGRQLVRPGPRSSCEAGLPRPRSY